MTRNKECLSEEVRQLRKAILRTHGLLIQMRKSASDRERESRARRDSIQAEHWKVVETLMYAMLVTIEAMMRDAGLDDRCILGPFYPLDTTEKVLAPEEVQDLEQFFATLGFVRAQKVTE